MTMQASPASHDGDAETGQRFARLTGKLEGA
jgi:hypothetical protein